MADNKCLDGAADEGDPQGMHDFLQEWSQRASCNGLGNIGGTDEKPRKFLWILVVTAGVVLTVYQMADAILNYYDYPYDVTIGLEQALSVDFPAVTVCNINPARSNLLAQYMQSGQNTAGLSLPSTTSNTGAQRAAATESFLHTWAAINISIREAIGHQLEDTILDCTYGGDECNFTTDFVTFNNVHHGNCWTYNSVNSGVSKTAHRVGPTNGLKLEIYIDQALYVTDLVEDAGIRLIVHDRSAFPFPEVFGINVSPGKSTSISVRRTQYTRLEEPYDSECYDASDKTVRTYDAYAGLHGVEYAYLGCQRTYYQASLLSECGCADATLPFDRKEVMSMVNNQTAISSGFMPCATPSEVSCADEVTDRFYGASLFNCHLPCSEERYTFSVTESIWPSSLYSAEYFAALGERFPNYNDTLQSSDATNNVLKVKVFFESINYETISESGSYDVWELLADIGGVFGFWLGLSVVALFEFLELFVDVMMLGVRLIKDKNRVKVMNTKANPTC